MNRILLPVFCLLGFIHLPAATAADSPEKLITACKEVIDIYSNRAEQRLLAGLTTGPAEALRAGYCIGVLSEYRRQYQCYTGSWYEQAERIAELSVTLAPRTSFDELLEISCEL